MIENNTILKLSEKETWYKLVHKDARYRAGSVLKLCLDHPALRIEVFRSPEGEFVLDCKNFEFFEEKLLTRDWGSARVKALAKVRRAIKAWLDALPQG